MPICRPRSAMCWTSSKKDVKMTRGHGWKAGYEWRQRLQSFVFDTLVSLVMGCRSLYQWQPSSSSIHTRSISLVSGPIRFFTGYVFFKVFNQLKREIGRHPVRFLHRELEKQKVAKDCCTNVYITDEDVSYGIKAQNIKIADY